MSYQALYRKWRPDNFNDVKGQDTKKTTENSDDSESDIYDDDDEDSQTITCTSAVYLHPEPTSSSANLLTIPSGAECKFFRNENGWYFVEYNGTQGYAWNTFFTSPQE